MDLETKIIVMIETRKVDNYNIRKAPFESLRNSYALGRRMFRK